MHSEVAWVLVLSETQVHPQKILESGYLPDYLSVTYDYVPSLCHVFQDPCFQDPGFPWCRFFRVWAQDPGPGSSRSESRVRVQVLEVAGLEACNFIKKRLQHRCFPVKFTKACNFIEKKLQCRCFPGNLRNF